MTNVKYRPIYLLCDKMLMPKSAKIFIVLLGFIFIITAIGVSLTFDYPNVVPIGISIVGLFLIILPFTYQGKR